jgi:restriction system protein
MDIALGIAQLVALLVLGGMFVPPLRQMLLGIGMLAVGGVVLAGLVALGVFIIRRSERKPPYSAAGRSTLQVTVSPPPTVRVEANPPPQQPVRRTTTAELIEQLRCIDWFQFEKLVGLVYRKFGYAVTRRGGANPDGGIDLVIQKDGQKTAVQCKQWKTWNVGVKAVREFLGALTDAGIQKGIVITLCGYAGEAKQLAEKHAIEIVNEVGLARMLEQTDARFDAETLAILLDTRKFCPKCEREMSLKTARRGKNAGQQFWGCQGYPNHCNYTLPP